MIPGNVLEELRNAISTGYSKSKLRDLLRFRFDKDMEDIVADAALNTMASDLLKLAEEEGWLIDLAREAYRFNPGNEGLLRVYEKLGMSPKIQLGQGGDAIANVDARSSSAGLQKIISANNPTFDINVWRTRLADVEVRVCRIDIANRGMGTGFLVGPDTVLTNYHVVESIITGKKPASALSCLFDYKVLSDNTQNPGIRVQLNAAQGILAYAPYSAAEKAGKPEEGPPPTEDELDFALLRLERRFAEEPAGSGRGCEKLPSYPAEFTKDMGIIIAQHPSGVPMKLAIDTQSVISSTNTRVRYKTNTEGGSSGSPVFDMMFTLCALHHYGDPSFQHPAYNQGIVPLHLIRKKIEEAGFGESLAPAM